MITRANNAGAGAPQGQPNNAMTVPTASMLSKMASVVANPWSDNRFGKIPTGIHNVEILDARWVRACESSKLDDNGKFAGFETKEGFNMAFDQDVLWIVYADDSDRILIDRAYLHSWMKVDDPHASDLIRTYKLQVDESGRLIRPNGTGVEECTFDVVNGQFTFSKSNSRTKTMINNLLQRFSAADVSEPITKPEALIGKRVQIEVIYDKSGNTNVVNRVYKENYKQVTAVMSDEVPPMPDTMPSIASLSGGSDAFATGNPLF